MSELFFTSPTSKFAKGAVAQQFPFFGDGRPVVFWAERGLVHYEDSRENAGSGKRTGSLSWKDAAERVLALSQMAINSAEDRRWNKERQRLQQFVCEMEKVIREAKDQGCPFDEEAIADRRRRRPVSVVKPTIIENF